MMHHNIIIDKSSMETPSMNKIYDIFTPEEKCLGIIILNNILQKICLGLLIVYVIRQKVLRRIE